MNPNSATIIVPIDKGYQLTYIYGFFEFNPDIKTIDVICGNPNIRYRFENNFNHFLFFKDSLEYDGFGKQHSFSKLVDIKEEDLGLENAKNRCLEILLNDQDILYKEVFLKEGKPSKLNKINIPHAGWVD